MSGEPPVKPKPLADTPQSETIEDRARLIAEANSSAPTIDPMAIRVARYLLGEGWH